MAIINGTVWTGRGFDDTDGDRFVMLGERAVINGELLREACGLDLIFVALGFGGGAIGTLSFIGISGCSCLISVLIEIGSRSDGATEPDRLRSRGSMLIKPSIAVGAIVDGI